MSKDAVYEFVTRVDSDPEIDRALRGAAGVDAIVRIAGERGFAFTAGELTPVLDLLRFLDNARRDAWLRGELASARDHEAIVALARRRGYAFSSDELAHLDVAPASGQLAEHDLDRVVGGTNINRMEAPAQALRPVDGGETDTQDRFRQHAGCRPLGGRDRDRRVAAPFIPGGAVVSAAARAAARRRPTRTDERQPVSRYAGFFPDAGFFPEPSDPSWALAICSRSAAALSA